MTTTCTRTVQLQTANTAPTLHLFLCNITARTMHRSGATSRPEPCTNGGATQDNLLTYVSRNLTSSRGIGTTKPVMHCVQDGSKNPYRNVTAQSPKQLSHRGNQQTARTERTERPMPDRYGEPDDEPIVDLDAPVTDFDSGRRAREAAAARQRASEQRGRLAESRAVHAPLDSAQSAAVRQHRHAVTDRAEAWRRAARIANCPLCDDEGYTPGLMICDHIDHTPAYASGMAHLREVMGWDSTDERNTTGVGASRPAGPRTTPATPLSPGGAPRGACGTRSGDSESEPTRGHSA